MSGWCSICYRLSRGYTWACSEVLRKSSTKINKSVTIIYCQGMHNAFQWNRWSSHNMGYAYSTQSTYCKTNLTLLKNLLIITITRGMAKMTTQKLQSLILKQPHFTLIWTHIHPNEGTKKHKKHEWQCTDTITVQPCQVLAFCSPVTFDEGHLNWYPSVGLAVSIIFPSLKEISS